MSSTEPEEVGTTTKPNKNWKRMTEGWVGTIVYVFIGIGLALLAKQALAFGLSTDMPVVAVVSESMQHDNAARTHYGWLESRFGYSSDEVNSWSVPTGFFVGDMPIVHGSEEYQIGDVIVYQVPGQSFPIIHRIVKINSDGTYQTKGDNNMEQWPYELSVKESQIYGKVMFVVPKLGYVKVLFTSVFGF